MSTNENGPRAGAESRFAATADSNLLGTVSRLLDIAIDIDKRLKKIEKYGCGHECDHSEFEELPSRIDDLDEWREKIMEYFRIDEDEL